jgi:capsid assembly protease
MHDTFLPLTTLALSIDQFWSIEPGWAMRAKAAMDTIDVGVHTVEFLGRAPRAPLTPQFWGEGGRAYADDADEEGGDRGRREREPKKPYRIVDGVAYLYLTGPLTKRPQSWGGGTSTILFRRHVRCAVADVDVKAILIVIDSPGGQVAGTCDAAGDVAWAGKQKPVAVLCEDQCCSAAYWIGCQAGYGMFCNPTATVGSIGTITVLEDTSEAAAEAGVKVHVVTTGDRKSIGVPGVEVTEEQLAYVHDYLDLMNAQFAGAVRRSRKLAPDQMTEILRAGIYVGKQAVAMGLCCGVHSLDEVHVMLVGADGRSSAQYVPLAPPCPPQAGGPESGGAMQLPQPASRSGSETSLPVSPISGPPACGGQGGGASGSVGDSGRGRAADIVPSVRSDRSVLNAGRTGEVKMRDILIRALQAFGLSRMAVAVVESKDESAEALASAMSGQVNAEVEERIARHPLVMACCAAGIHEPADLGRTLDMARLGADWLTELRSDAKAQAIRAFGYDRGMVVGAQVNSMDLRNVRTMRDAWAAEADVKYGIGADGSGAQRMSAPMKLNEKVNESAVATTGAEAAATEPKNLWDKLSPTQREYGTKLGMNTPEKREQYAKDYFEAAANALA